MSKKEIEEQFVNKARKELEYFIKNGKPGKLIFEVMPKGDLKIHESKETILENPFKK